MADQLASNVYKTALVFEGGAMRAAYTSAVAAELLERGVYFDNVYGVSAGSSITVNYVSRDIDRTVSSFTEFVKFDDTGDWRTLLAHKGIFNAHRIYHDMAQPDGELPFDMHTFMANPAKVTVVALERDTGRSRYFTKADMATLDDLMLCVRASSTIPVLMPPPTVRGSAYYDGAFAEGGGLPLARVFDDGLTSLFVVRTRPRGYRKTDANPWAHVSPWRSKAMREAARSRYDRYNAACGALDCLERAGKAYVFYSDELTLSGNDRDYDKLCRNFERGQAQIRREWGQLMDFLDKAED